MNAELFMQKEGDTFFIYATFDNDLIALSDEFEYSWETLRQEVIKMINFVKGMGFNVETTLP